MNLNKNIHSSTPSFSQRVVSNVMWAFAMRAADRLLILARFVVLARLLMPEDFGLFALATLTLTAIEALSTIGFGPALIQKKENISSWLDTSWTTAIMRGTILSLVLFLCAGYVANFFNTPHARPYIQAIAGIFLIRGFSNVGIVYFQKELQFHKFFFYVASQSFIALIVAVIFALLWRNTWALVLGLLAGELSGLTLSYVLQPYRPRLRFDLQKAKELYKYGRWVFLSYLIVFVKNRLDMGVVGKVLGSVMLGYYQLGPNTSDSTTGAVGLAISNVTFPAFAKIQDNLPQLRRAFYRIWESTACLSIPMALIIFFTADGIVKVVFGPQWLPAIPVIKYMVLYGCVNSLVQIGGTVFSGTGHPRLEMQMYLTQIIVTAVLVYPFIRWMGISGAALSVLCGGLANLPLMVHYSFTLLGISFRGLLKASLVPLIFGLTIMATTLLAKLGLNSGTFTGLVGIVFINLLVYAGISCALWWKFRLGPIQALAALRGG